jgi:hypothetical protein
VVSLGLDADGNRIRRKVSGQTRTEVKEKLKAIHSELDAGIRTAASYTVDMAVTDWLAEGLPGRAAKTVEVYRDVLGPVRAVIGRSLLRDLTVQDARGALAKMAGTHSTPTLQKAHNCLTRALRHAEGRDLVRRNVSALVDTPHGREGRPSQALSVEQAAALLEAAVLASHTGQARTRLHQPRLPRSAKAAIYAQHKHCDRDLIESFSSA